MAAYESYEQENMAYWTNRAPGYSAVHQNELSSGQRDVWRRTLLQHIEAACGKESASSIRVLDVGTGPGFFAILLAERGYEVTAVDYTASMLEEARYNAGRLGRPLPTGISTSSSRGTLRGTFRILIRPTASGGAS